MLKQQLLVINVLLYYLVLPVVRLNWLMVLHLEESRDKMKMNLFDMYSMGRVTDSFLEYNIINQVLRK